MDENLAFQLMQGYAFPVSPKWYFRPVVRHNLSVPVGESRPIIDEYSYGWLLSAYWIQTSPKINMHLLFESKQGTAELNIRPDLDFAAFSVGTVAAGIAFNLEKYDLINSIFSYTMHGVFPGAPWQGTLQVTAKNEGNYDASILELWVHRVIVVKALPTRVISEPFKES